MTAAEHDTTVRPFAVARVVVPLDGSDDASRTVPIGRRLADRLGASLTLLAVAAPAEHRAALEHHLVEAAAPVGAETVVVDGDDVATAILAFAASQADSLVC